MRYDTCGGCSNVMMAESRALRVMITSGTYSVWQHVGTHVLCPHRQGLRLSVSSSRAPGPGCGGSGDLRGIIRGCTWSRSCASRGRLAPEPPCLQLGGPQPPDPQQPLLCGAPRLLLVLEHALDALVAFLPLTIAPSTAACAQGDLAVGALQADA